MRAGGKAKGASDVRRWVVLLLVASLLLLAPGCAGRASDSSTRARAADVAIEPWSYDGHKGSIVRTPHYRIHTTIEDREMLLTLARAMEGALAQYQRFVPGVRLSTRPMDCYVFARHTEWARFTAERTGADAMIYLKIRKGGYTVRDWYVAYFIGDVGTYAVATHEGWHQFVARHFRSRLPPFLEEGIATMFESITWSNGRPRWGLAANPSRAAKLRRAIDAGNLWPLEQLATMHAGDVVNLPGERIETFYAQNWAFAQFLWEGDGGRYRGAMQRMLSDLAAGTAPERLTGRRGAADLWNPGTAKPLLEHYLQTSLPDLERAYLAYVHQLARKHRDDP